MYREAQINRMVFTSNGTDSCEKKLNELLAQGWKVVMMTGAAASTGGVWDKGPPTTARFRFLVYLERA